MAVLVRIAVDDKGNPKILEVNKNINKLKQSATNLGPVLEKAFAVAGMLMGLQKITQGIGAATDEILKFEQAMARIKGIGDITGEALKSTGSLARDMAKHTEFSASTIAGAMLEVVKMGFKAEELKNVMPSMLDLASAAMMDLNYAATNTISTMNQFGMAKTIEEVTRTTNVLATVLNATGSDAADFMESMKYAGAVAKTTGISFEETAAIIGILADAGIKGTQAGTTLRSLFIRFLQPTGAVKEGLKKLGIEGKTLSEILVGLKKQGLNVIDFLDTFDRTAITGTMRLADEDAMNKLKNLNVDLLAQAVKIKDVATIVRENLVVSSKELVNNLNEIALSIFDAFGDRPSDAVAGLITQVQALDKWVDENHKTFQDFANALQQVLKIGGQLASTVLPALVNNATLLAMVFGASQLLKNLPFIVSGLTAVGKAASTAMSLQLVERTQVWNKELATATTQTKILGQTIDTGLTTSIQGMTAALSAGLAIGTSLKTILEAAANSWSQNIDNALAKGAMRTTKEGMLDEIKDLERLEAAHQKIADARAGIMANQGTGAGTVNTRMFYEKLRDEASAAYWKLHEELVGEYGGLYMGRVNTLKGTQNQLYNTRRRYYAKDKVAETEPDKKPDKKPEDKPAKVKPWAELGVQGFGGYGKFEPKLDNTKLWETQVKAYEQMDWLTNFLEEETKKQLQIRLQAEYDAKQMIIDSYWSMGESITSIYETISMKKAQIAIDSAEKEKAAIEKRFEAEERAASGSAFLREMAEQKKAKAVIEADKKIEAAKRAAEKRQRAIDSAMATANMFKAVIGTIAETHGNAAVRIASGAVVAGIVGSYLAQLVAINYRDGSQGLVTGPGNTTSDSIPARVSAGEWILSKRDVDRLGGPSSIQQAIDRGVNYTNTRNSNVHIGTVIGTKQFVRESIVPVIREELRR